MLTSTLMRDHIFPHVGDMEKLVVTSLNKQKNTGRKMKSEWEGEVSQRI